MSLQRIQLRAPSFSATRPASPAGPATRAIRRVLIVDDDADVCHSVAEALRDVTGSAAEVTEATHPFQAIELIKQRTFDMVLTDYRMPDANGLDVLAAVRARSSRTHRVLMTSYADVVADPVRLCAAEVDAYVQKPFGIEDLTLLAQGFLGNAPSLVAAYRAHARQLEKEAAPS